MKKSKILIPAFAVLALSVGASITGTVAWFTAAKTANITISNVAAVNVAGDLSVKLSPVSGAFDGGATVDGQSATLTPLLDASFDGTSRYNPTTSTDLNCEINITGLRKLGDSEVYKDLTVTTKEGPKAVKAYFINQFNMTFSTSSQEDMYLLFSPSKSKLDGYTRAQKNIYNALRVMLDFDGKQVIWAPYTYESKLYTAFLEGTSDTVKTAFPASDAFDAQKYVNAQDKTLLKSWEDSKISTGEADFTEVSSKAAIEESKSLLSTTLKKGNNLTVKTTIWFEGLDHDCLSGVSGVQTTAAEITGKVLNMAFYALPTSGFAA